MKIKNIRPADEIRDGGVILGNIEVIKNIKEKKSLELVKRDIKRIIKRGGVKDEVI